MMPSTSKKQHNFMEAIAHSPSFAKKVGGVLPDRRELRLAWVNTKDAFKPDWYWSGEKHASDSDSAWMQHFYNGGQHYYDTGGQYRARAVRRLEIQ